MDWLTAHRVAGIAAAHLHRDLGLPEGEYVDIFAAIVDLDLAVMAQPMPRLFGVYLPPTPQRMGGILLNSGLDEATIRHSAAHEWGHRALNHGRCFAQDLDPFSTSSRTWTPDEKQAEAFAAWFLMPIKAVKRALARIGIDRPRTVEDVYQLSLHLGTSYRGMLRHLQHLRMIPPNAASAWATVQPARLRERLSGDRHNPPPRVWSLGAAAHGARMHVEVGDRLIIRSEWVGDVADCSVPDGVDVINSPTGALPVPRELHLDVTTAVPVDSSITVKSLTDGSTWSIRLVAAPASRRGLLSADRPAKDPRDIDEMGGR